MSGFCITSLIQDDAEFVLSLLQKAGLEAAQPSQRDETMTMSRWHEQVLTLPIEFYVASFAEKTETAESSTSSDGQSLQPAGWGSGQGMGVDVGSNVGSYAGRDMGHDMARDIGRLWEQLASDIFIANMNSLHWGWADARSADLLPFWAGFDPQLKFVLVTCSPERYLANFIETSDKPFAPEVLLARWQAYHKALLQFSRLYPKRCVITSFEDVLMSPQGLIDTCNETFFTQLGRVGLSALKGFPVAQMAALVATKFSTPTKDQEALERELRVSLTPLKVTMNAPRLGNASGSGETADETGDSEAGSYRKSRTRRRGNDENGATGDEFYSAPRDADGGGLDQSGAEQDAEEDVTIVDFVADDDLPASNDPAEIIAHYRRILAEVRRAEPEWPRSRTSGEVMDVHYRDSYANEERRMDAFNRDSEQMDLQAKLKDTEEENDLLLAQLHQVQEELENYFLKHQDVSAELEALQARFQKLLARVPGYLEVDSLEVVKHDKSKALSTQWLVKGLESAGGTVPELKFRTFVENGVACLEFQRSEDGETALKRWPAGGDEYEAVVSAVGDEITGPHRAKVLQSISTSDWLLVKTLNTLLTKELEKPELVKLPRGFNAKGLGKAVSELQSHLNALPPVFHFDELKLRSYQEDAELEYLWFGFSNVMFGERHVPSFEFRFASVNIPAGNFGSNPRLEFPELGSKDLFDNWFRESDDELGAKLELRFAKPGAMDMDVWAQVNPEDKKLIGAIIAQLPMFIDQLRSSDAYPSYLTRSSDEWRSLAETVHNYFLSCSGSALQELGLEEGEEQLLDDEALESDDENTRFEAWEDDELTDENELTDETEFEADDAEAGVADVAKGAKRLSRRSASGKTSSSARPTTTQFRTSAAQKKTAPQKKPVAKPSTASRNSKRGLSRRG